MATVDYGYLREVVRGRSHNILDPSRDDLLEMRLAKLVRNQGMSDLRELVDHVRRTRDASLEFAIADAMTINETSFFRDRRPFELLRNELLPALMEARKTQRTLRLWSAASSTGQEAYSLAMMIREHFPQLGQWNVRVEGTDICDEVVKRASEGRYLRIEVNRGLPARNLILFFDQVGADWVIKPEIREMCHFRKANLCVPPLPFSQKFDVIFLRNVMLYFGPETRRTLMAEVHRLLAPDGVLFLGSTEQPADLSLWKPALAGGTCYFQPLPQRKK